MAYIYFKDIDIARDFEYHTCESQDFAQPNAYSFDVLYVELADGRKFYRPAGRYVLDEEGGDGYVNDYDPDEMLPVLKKRGYINSFYWTELHERPAGAIPEWATLEFAWREQQDCLLSGY